MGKNSRLGLKSLSLCNKVLPSLSVCLSVCLPLPPPPSGWQTGNKLLAFSCFSCWFVTDGSYSNCTWMKSFCASAYLSKFLGACTSDHAHSCGYLKKIVLRLIKHHSFILVLCVGEYMQNSIILVLVKGRLWAFTISIACLMLIQWFWFSIFSWM